ncbi:MAG: DUF7508 domain-containing protein [Acidimicrobiales bacterium]|jgi:hypothetical protein
MSGGIRFEKPWRALEADALAALPATMGVYEIGDLEGRIVFIGFAGGRSLFGLRSELQGELAQRGEGKALFRSEENMQYMSRYDELLMVHVADHGSVPDDNDGQRRIGRLSPG